MSTRGSRVLAQLYDNPWFASPDIHVTLAELGLHDETVDWDEVEEWDGPAPLRAVLRPHVGVFDDLTDLYAGFDPAALIAAAKAPVVRRRPRRARKPVDRVEPVIGVPPSQGRVGIPGPNPLPEPVVRSYPRAGKRARCDARWEAQDAERGDG